MDIGYVRKKASLELGRKQLQDPVPDAAAVVLLQKAATADQELLKIASRLPGDTLENYEELGGTFSKEAIGTPMFQPAAPAQPGQQPQGLPALKPQLPKIPGAPGMPGGSTGGGIPNASIPSQESGQTGVKAAAARMRQSFLALMR